MKKLLGIFMVFALMLFAAGLVACGGEDGGKSQSTTGPEANETPGETAPEDKSYKADYLPQADYGGYDFRMMAPASDAYDLVTAADVEEETGDTVNDAIYKRNRVIEERYNIKIRQVSVADYQALTNTFKKSTAAASDEFDLGMMISRDAWSTSLTGAVIPVDRLGYVDISQPWYSRDVNSEMSINGRLYFAYSDECLNMFEQTLCVLFNKQMSQDLALDNMYNLVKENKWTIDKFFELAKTAVLDMDGDGQMTDADRYGILSQSDMFYPCFWVSSGIKTIGKDENDLLVFVGDSAKLYDVLGKVYDNIWGGEKILFDVFSDKITSYTHSGGEDQRRVSSRQFEDNRGLFSVRHIGVIPTLRAMETDFGILPFPKYDGAQEKYYSRIIDGWLNCVPVTAQDTDRTSVIMEALAVESKNITIPAYFEVALNTKHARDDESQEMLDIIHANRTVDLGDTFYMDPVRNIYVGTLTSKKNDFASQVEKKTNAVNKVLAKANETAMGLD